MKKKLIVLFILVLSLFTAVHLAMADGLPSGVTVEEGIANTSGKGKITIIGVSEGTKFKLIKEDENGDEVDVTTETGAVITPSSFSNLDIGKYYVVATKDVDGKDVEFGRSKAVTVKPPVVTFQPLTKGSNTITVSKVVDGAEIKFYIGATEVESESTGTNTYKLPAGIGYTVKQKFNEVLSDPSTNTFTSYPEPIDQDNVKAGDAGPNDNAGVITVSKVKTNNTIKIVGKNYTSSKTVKEVDGHEAKFSGLKAGTYSITQIENGVESYPPIDKMVEDKQAPVIKLKKGGISEVSGDTPSDPLIVEYGKVGSDPGAIVTDNFDPDDEIPAGKDWVTDEDVPGTYEVKYNATDSSGNAATEVIRTVKIIPNTVKPTATDTDPDDPNDSTGEITVTDFIRSTSVTLYLYQNIGNDEDTTNDIRIGSPIEITDADIMAEEKIISVKAVKYNLYVIQKYKTKDGKTLSSVHSIDAQVNILDKTPPVLTVKPGKDEIVAGDTYTDPGATATDNIDSSIELTKKIITTGKVNTNIPGKYTLTYDVEDNAGLPAKSVTRTVKVIPQAVIATGSTADIREVSIRNGYPGATLILYDKDNNKVDDHTLDIYNGETTYTFENLGPGFYYVTQTVNVDPDLTSKNSNMVEVVDIDRPYITLIGSEEYSFVWKKSELPDYNGDENKFYDQGVTVKDYLADLGKDTLTLTTELAIPNSTELITHTTEPITNTKGIFKYDFNIDQPGVYTITYKVKAGRGAEAVDKQRIITIAPPKTATPESVAGTSQITVDPGVDYGRPITTTVNLYNTYNQLIASDEILNTETAVFNEVYAGIGYYVTQTVNGIESAPSDPVTVSPFEDADKDKFIGFKSFSIKGINATGIIDQLNGTITITVPYEKREDVKNLTAEYTLIQGTETVTVNDGIKDVVQKSGDSDSVQDFTKTVTYTVHLSNNRGIKTYKVTVQVAESPTKTWLNSVKKSVTLKKDQVNTFSLTSAEKAAATENGMSFIADDIAIHVAPANIKESSNPTLTVKSIDKVSFIASTEASWKTDLTNILEIGWEGHSESFLQPIEVEIPDPDQQTFVRLVREDGKLYAIIQPKRKLGSHTVGLATMSGTYALLDKTVTAKITKDVLGYKLSSNYWNASIYYTTEGKQITFARSANNQNVVESYLFNGKISDLTNNWNKYENKAISVPESDLYTVAMYDQIISKVETLGATPAEAWHDEVQTVKPSKVWSITFNAKVDRKALFSNVIRVTDDTTGKEVKDVLLQLSDDGKTISIAPKNPYKSNHQYTLWIEKPIQSSSSKEFLKAPKKLTFIAK